MALAKSVETKAARGWRVQRGTSMSRCGPPGTESQHQGVKAAGPVGCVAGRTHLT